MFQYDPIDVKRLARGAHERDLDEIAVQEGMIAVSCSGTIGRVHIIPEYMSGWTVNQHATRVVCHEKEDDGYVYTWLASSWGLTLLRRLAYGSVILEVDAEMIGSIPVPVLGTPLKRRIEKLVTEANRMRSDAWYSEQTALAILREELGEEAPQ